MLTNLVSLTAALGLFHGGAVAGTYKNITVDGDFADWAGVPLLASDPLDNPGSVDYADIYLANDDNYLYIRFTLHTAADPFTWQQNIFLDADNSVGTGFGAGGLGSEMLIQGGAGYQEKNGGFNEGGISGLGWAAPRPGPEHNSSCASRVLPSLARTIPPSLPAIPLRWCWSRMRLPMSGRRRLRWFIPSKQRRWR